MARAPAKKDTGPINIEPVARASVTVWVCGTTPLIFHAMSQKARQTLLLPPPAPMNRTAKRTTLKHDPLSEYVESTYRFLHNDAPTRLYIPATAFKAALRAAALRVPGVHKTEIGQLAWVRGSGSTGSDHIPVYGVPQLMMSVVRNADGVPDIRTRAIVPEWCCSMRLMFVDKLLTDSTIVNLCSTSGMLCGVGDWRQEKGSGSYGQFRLCNHDDAEYMEIAASYGLAEQDAALNTNEPQCYDSETEQLLAWYNQELARRGSSAAATPEDEGTTTRRRIRRAPPSNGAGDAPQLGA